MEIDFVPIHQGSGNMKRKFYFLLLVSILCLGGMLISCGNANKSASNDSLIQGYLYKLFSAFDPTQMLANLGGTVIPNLYKDLESKSSNLSSSATSYTASCPGTQTAIQTMQSQWKDAMASAKKAEIIQFGPAVLGGYYSLIDSWPSSYTSHPPDTAFLESQVSGSGTLDKSTVSTWSKTARGLPSLGYLLFQDGSGNSDLTSICTALQGRRLLLLQALSQDLAAQSSSLYKNWDPTSGNFSSQLVLAGQGSDYYTTKESALDTILSSMIDLVKAMKDDKLEYPAGLSSNNSTANSNYVESVYSQNSVTDLLNNLEGFKLLYLGDGGIGLSSYVSYVAPTLDAEIQKQWQECYDDIQKTGNLQSKIQSNDLTAIKEAIFELGQLEMMLSTELASALGTSPITGGSGGDGD